MECKDCRTSLRVDDVWKLYNPNLSVTPQAASSRCQKSLRGPKGCGASSGPGKCSLVCNSKSCCLDLDQFKEYWNKNCDIPLIRRYEEQPWFRNPVVQANLKYFVDNLVTPQNIGYEACPGPDDWQFKCHKSRALIGPTIPCVWELPEQDGCASAQYGYNRDWRRYNEDQGLAASDISCGCNNQPVCSPKKKRCEWPPYLGKSFGPRYRPVRTLQR